MINKKIKALLFVCMVASIGGSKGSSGIFEFIDEIKKNILKEPRNMYTGATIVIGISLGLAATDTFEDAFDKIRSNYKELEKKDIAILTALGTTCVVSAILLLKATKKVFFESS